MFDALKDLSAGDILVFERSSVIVTSVVRRPDGITYTLGGNLTLNEWPPKLLVDVGELKAVMRPKLFYLWTDVR